MLRSSMIKINCSSVLGNFVDNTGKPLQYHRDDSVVVFRYYQQFLSKFATYKSKSFYSGVHNWMQTTQASKHLSITISADMLASLPQSVSSMFLNNTIFVSDRIAMFSHLLSHLNSSSSDNLLLAISDLTRLEIGPGESIIDYMSRVHVISQYMQGITMDAIIPLFSIASLYHNRCPGVNSRYHVGDPALFNCKLLDIIGLLPVEESRQKVLVLTRSTPSATENRVYNTQTQPPPTGHPQTCLCQPPMPTSSID